MDNGVELRPVNGWPLYLVGSDGYVRSMHGGVMTKLKGNTKSSRGYSGWKYVTLTDPVAGRKRVYVHTLVCTAFNPPPARPDQKEVRHLDGNPSNNVPSNLAWGNRVENFSDMIAHGRSNRGARSPQAKLNDEAVKVIKHFTRKVVQGVLAGLYGVSRATICEIQSGKSWAWTNQKEMG